MRPLNTPAKLLLGAAAASLAALGIVMVASSVPAPSVEIEKVGIEKIEKAKPTPAVRPSTPPPPTVIIPAPDDHARPLPAPSR